MSHLLSKKRVSPDSSMTQNITPESAKWTYVGFEAHTLKAGQNFEIATESNEVCVVLLGGKVNASTNENSWDDIGDRESVFDLKAPFAVYAPAQDTIKITAISDIELGVCKAPSKGNYSARLIRPEDCQFETRGVGTNTRHVCNVLFGNLAADSLLVCEVVTPSGNWSSYPPHKHDQDAAPAETQLEETYYHKIDPPQGFVFQRVYNDDRSLDETMSVEDGDVVMVPEGYHPVGVPHGYQSYYLNVMAGPSRNWIFHNDKDHEWIIERDKKTLAEQATK
ncbi:5-deoxy-glucuronate isomerase [Marinomonas mediterranea]|uniref:Myo-inositol catabolism IolB domain-containing protein n=1 Tax=Marinomonas mediterranea (strain ATCC 700492 / JCM 21426 / NBRC 103028 / MMB-1) TaxID=717774 RepID=F2K348_MARM1|nr:5-deoxy-glucuronate isomerase [Marinomonas mediterranea]ADZ90101.1 myo-inositol catabolism IolB domain-containing protein [Marinomonas mediterranea MMB-1]WCN16306.1 5-deoxy-glucuronate isomerase [Marinomonas mediterranea MMB-1]